MFETYCVRNAKKFKTKKLKNKLKIKRVKNNLSLPPGLGRRL